MTREQVEALVRQIFEGNLPEGVTVLLLHPGAVLTERQANLNFPGMIEMEPSVTGMIDVIAKATLADTGHFIQYDGTPAPW